MPKLLVHLTCGLENPTRATLGFLVPSELAMPNRLVQLAFESDRVLTY